MKKLLLTSALVAISAGAFAQGKVNAINDGASLVTLTTDTTKIKTADVGLAGQPVGNATPLPSGIVLMGGLYAGTSSTALFLYTPNSAAATLMNNASAGPGLIGPFQVQLTAANSGAANLAIPGIASGTAIGASTPWFDLRVWDSTYASYAAAAAAGGYIGQSAVFQLNPGPSLSYTFTAPAGANSTWADAPITLFLAPEPSTFALAGLGAAALMIFRRRK